MCSFPTFVYFGLAIKTLYKTNQTGSQHNTMSRSPEKGVVLFYFSRLSGWIAERWGRGGKGNLAFVSFRFFPWFGVNWCQSGVQPWISSLPLSLFCKFSLPILQNSPFHPGKFRERPVLSAWMWAKCFQNENNAREGLILSCKLSIIREYANPVFAQIWLKRS